MKTLPQVFTALFYCFSAHFVIAESQKWEIFNLKDTFELPDKTLNPASWVSRSYEIINAPEKHFDINQDLEQKWGDEAWYRFICISESKVTLSQDGFEDYIGSNEYKDCITKNRNRDSCNNNRFKAGFSTKVGPPPPHQGDDIIRYKNATHTNWPNVSGTRTFRRSSNQCICQTTYAKDWPLGC